MEYIQVKNSKGTGVINMDPQMVKDLITVQKEIKNPPNTAENPYHHNRYAPLSDILNIVRPILAKNNFILVQNTGSEPQSDKVYVETILIHKSGEKLASDKLYLSAKQFNKKKKSKTSRNGGQSEDLVEPVSVDINPQLAGSAITYGRRYQLSAFLGIASEDDDDGNSVSVSEKDEEESKPKSEKKGHKRRPKRAKKGEETKPEVADMTTDGIDWDKACNNNAHIAKYRQILEDTEGEVTADNILELAIDDGMKGAQLGAMRKILGVTAK